MKDSFVWDLGPGTEDDSEGAGPTNNRGDIQKPASETPPGLG